MLASLRRAVSIAAASITAVISSVSTATAGAVSEPPRPSAATNPASVQAPPRPDLEGLLLTPPAPLSPLSESSTRARAAIDRALAARDWPRAERLLVDEIERTPNSPALLKTLAGVFLMDRKPLNAAIALKKAEALGPLDAQSRFRLVLAYIAMKRGDWARPELERLARDEPSTAIYPYWLGRLHYDEGRYAEAMVRLKDAALRDPTFFRTFDNLGLCYEALNQPEDAIVQYREAIRLNRVAIDKSPWPALNLGILLRTRGELTDAEAFFREALTYDDGFARAHYQLGVVLEQTERTDAALKALDRAVSIDPAFPEPHYALARIYRRQGRVAQADAALATFQRLKGQPGAASR
jgi:tetratricopeptide (TPR) repeat protein